MSISMSITPLSSLHAHITAQATVIEESLDEESPQLQKNLAFFISLPKSSAPQFQRVA